MLGRRSVLKMAGLAALSTTMAPRVFGDPAPTRKRPRYVIDLLMFGGIDAIWTIDPKSKAQLEPGLDVPYASTDIGDSGGIPFGPHFKPLAKWLPEMAVLHGVQILTANHQSGTLHVTAMRAGAKKGGRSIFEILGEHQPGPATPFIGQGTIFDFQYSPGYLGGPRGINNLFDRMEAAEPDELRAISTVLLRQAKSLRKQKHLTRAEQLTAESHETVAALFAKVASVGKPTYEPWPIAETKESKALLADDRSDMRMQRALWLLENDLTSSLQLGFAPMDSGWDTHYLNESRQTALNSMFTRALDRFFTELKSRRNAGGTLFEQSAILLHSEIGRFPRINERFGKDHFPEAPFMFMGPCFNTGRVYGETDRRMIAKPISLATGNPDKAGHRVTIDDIGTTLMNLAGLDPLPYGYTGRDLTFLRRQA